MCVIITVSPAAGVDAVQVKDVILEVDLRTRNTAVVTEKGNANVAEAVEDELQETGVVADLEFQNQKTDNLARERNAVVRRIGRIANYQKITEVVAGIGNDRLQGE